MKNIIYSFFILNIFLFVLQWHNAFDYGDLTAKLPLTPSAMALTGDSSKSGKDNISIATAIPTPTPVPTSTPTATHTPIVWHWYVDDDEPPPGEGTCQRPFSTITQAIQAANDDDVIHVAAGIYYERLVIDKNNLTLLGGYQRSSPNTQSCYYDPEVCWYRDPVSYRTIIDAGTTGICVAFYNVIYGVLDGFHLIHGVNGILCNNSFPDILNNQIYYNGNPSDPNNFGAGICLIGSSPIIKNNLIFENHAGADGGGIEVFSNSSPEITFNTIADNTSVRYGSGIMIERDSCPNIYHNIIVNNSSNCGVYVKDVTCELSIQYNDVWGNTTKNYCGDILDQTGKNGNISADPLFFSGPCGNYYLEQKAAGQTDDSPCVDAGGVSAVDAEQNKFITRIDGVSDQGRVDLGYHCFDTVSPSIPGNFQVFPGNKRITLRWDEVYQEDLIGYNIYRCSLWGYPPPWECAYKEVCGGTFQDEGRVNGVNYFYKVVSVDQALNESNEIYVDNARATDRAPDSPGSLSCIAGNGVVYLNWPKVEGAAWYNVYRGTTPGCYSLLATQIRNNNYQDTSVQNGRYYYYVVTAYETHLYESAYSRECTAYPALTALPTATPTRTPNVNTKTPTSTPTLTPTATPSGPPNPPIMTPEPPFSCGTFNTVCWSDESLSGAILYQAQASEYPDFLYYRLSGWTPQTCYTFDNLKAQTTYYYRARAKNNRDQESAWGNVITQSTQDNIPPQIWLAGYWDTFISTAEGGFLKILAWIPTHLYDDIKSVCLYYGGEPVNVCLMDDGTQGDWTPRDGLYTFAVPIPPGAPHTELLLEIRAFDKANCFDIWPYLSIFATGKAGCCPPQLHLKSYDFLSDLSKTIEGEHAKSMDMPFIMVAGWMDTLVTDVGGGKIVLMAYVYDRNNDVSNVQLYVNKQPTGVFLHDDGSNGDWTPGDSVYTLAINVSPGAPAGEYLIELRAIDRSGNYSYFWPYLTIE